MPFYNSTGVESRIPSMYSGDSVITVWTLQIINEEVIKDADLIRKKCMISD